jgi:hypothetical protein
MPAVHFPALALAASVVGCRAPTQITFDVTTDVSCSEITSTAFTSGSLSALDDGQGATATTEGCASPDSIGSVVVIPSGSESAQVAVKIVTGLNGTPPEACTAGAQCIVAKRALNYIPHTPLVVRVAMEATCIGVICAGDTTCEEGVCVPATITDPTQCEGAGCGDVVDGGVMVDATLPTDGGKDATLLDAASDAEDASPDGDAAAPEPDASCGTCASPLVCERAPPAACGDPDWAEWPMPNTPADPSAPNQHGYTDNGDGTVTDDVTLLMWEQATAPPLDAGEDAGAPSYSFAAATSYCAGLVLGGHADWRVPSLVELVSIIDWSQQGSVAVDPLYFPSTIAGYYWSQTATSGSRWTLDLGGGYNGTDSETNYHYVMCVR